MSQTAEQLIKEGNLAEALVELQGGVRDNPASSALRIFLFQLLAVKGDYDRALTQLNVAADMDSEALLMAQAYRELLQCEGYRAAVFAGQRAPLLFGEPAPWIGRLVQALKLAATGDGAAANDIVQAAFAEAPTRPGTIDDVPFEWLADADMRLGPVLEAMINGKYYWVPFEAVAEISLTAPVDLRDLVWLPVEFKWVNGGDSVGFLPSRYPGDKTLADPQCALARKTEWDDLGADFFIGSGQKTLSTDTSDYPLLETQRIVFADLTD